MTLEQLRIFVAVAERCHVTRAAEAVTVAAMEAASVAMVVAGMDEKQSSFAGLGYLPALDSPEMAN